MASQPRSLLVYAVALQQDKRYLLMGTRYMGLSDALHICGPRCPPNRRDLFLTPQLRVLLVTAPGQGTAGCVHTLRFLCVLPSSLLGRSYVCRYVPPGDQEAAMTLETGSTDTWTGEDLQLGV